MGRGLKRAGYFSGGWGASSGLGANEAAGWNTFVSAAWSTRNTALVPATRAKRLPFPKARKMQRAR